MVVQFGIENHPPLTVPLAFYPALRGGNMQLSMTETDRFKIIKIVGKVSWDDAQDLDITIRKVIDEEGFTHLVFNLDEVNFICSGGIGALVFNLNRVKEKGGEMYLVSSSEYLNFIFETLRFDVVFDGYLYKDYEDFVTNVLEKKSA
jgi:anti-anti-sigma factor